MKNFTQWLAVLTLAIWLIAGASCVHLVYKVDRDFCRSAQQAKEGVAK